MWNLKNTCPFWDNGMPITKGEDRKCAGHLPSPLRADIWLQTFNPAGKCHATEFSPQDNDPSTPEAEWHPQFYPFLSLLSFERPTYEQ